MLSQSIVLLLFILTVAVFIGIVKVSSLAYSNKKMDQSIFQPKQNLSRLIHQNSQLNKTNIALASEIRDIHQVVLAKPQKNMTILSKYNIPIQLTFKKSSLYQSESSQIWKLDDGDNVLYSEKAANLKESQWQHFQIVNSKASSSLFSIGVMTEAKKKYYFCLYCSANDMLYIRLKFADLSWRGLFTFNFKESYKMQMEIVSQCSSARDRSCGTSIVPTSERSS